MVTLAFGVLCAFGAYKWDSEEALKRTRELYRLEKYQYEKAHPDEIPFMSYYEWLIDQD